MHLFRSPWLPDTRHTFRASPPRYGVGHARRVHVESAAAPERCPHELARFEQPELERARFARAQFERVRFERVRFEIAALRFRNVEADRKQKRDDPMDYGRAA
jgi:hypothetical protein